MLVSYFLFDATSVFRLLCYADSCVLPLTIQFQTFNNEVITTCISKINTNSLSYIIYFMGILAPEMVSIDEHTTMNAL